jgi:hypothetical protein
MDALYDVLGVDDTARKEKIDRQLQSIRQALRDVRFEQDGDLAPVLLAYALVECRLANCAIGGIGLMIARIYGANITLHKVTDDEQMKALLARIPVEEVQ